MYTNHKLLVDKDCPMCRSYGNCFVKYGMIDNESILPYQDIKIEVGNGIDMQRAKSEIAFWSVETNTTVYGIDALIQIISKRLPWLKSILNLMPLYFLLRQLYFFISYNRKLIIPVKPNQSKVDCNPELNLYYRWAYIIFVAAVTAIILNNYFGLMLSHFEIYANPLMEWFICFGQILWQFIFIKLFAPKKWIDYLGNMSTVSLLGGILLIPILWINHILALPIVLLIIYFIGVVTIMVLEHLRRCHILKISHFMTASWILYRCFVLMLFLFTIIKVF